MFGSLIKEGQWSHKNVNCAGTPSLGGGVPSNNTIPWEKCAGTPISYTTSWVKVRFSSLLKKCIELNSKESTAEAQTPSNSYVSSLPENMTGKNYFSIRFYSI